MKQHYDIGILGAGPIGGYLAAELSKKHDSIVLFEQHQNIGIPMNCAGLITPRVFENFSIPKQNIIQNEILGANIHSPSGYTLSIGGDKTHAISINRTTFDKYLVETAKKSIQTDEEIIEKARESIRTGELESIQNFQKAAENIFEFGV